MGRLKKLKTNKKDIQQIDDDLDELLTEVEEEGGETQDNVNRLVIEEDVVELLTPTQPMDLNTSDDYLHKKLLSMEKVNFNNEDIKQKSPSTSAKKQQSKLVLEMDSQEYEPTQDMNGVLTEPFFSDEEEKEVEEVVQQESEIQEQQQQQILNITKENNGIQKEEQDIDHIEENNHDQSQLHQPQLDFEDKHQEEENEVEEVHKMEQSVEDNCPQEEKEDTEMNETNIDAQLQDEEEEQDKSKDIESVEEVDQVIQKEKDSQTSVHSNKPTQRNKEIQDEEDDDKTEEDSSEEDDNEEEEDNTPTQLNQNHVQQKEEENKRGSHWIGEEISCIDGIKFYNGFKFNGLNYYTDFLVLIQDEDEEKGMSIYKISSLFQQDDCDYIELVIIQRPEELDGGRKPFHGAQQVYPTKQVITKKLSNIRRMIYCTIERFSLFETRDQFPINAFYCHEKDFYMLDFKGKKRLMYDEISLVSPPVSQSILKSSADSGIRVQKKRKSIETSDGVGDNESQQQYYDIGDGGFNNQNSIESENTTTTPDNSNNIHKKEDDDNEDSIFGDNEEENEEDEEAVNRKLLKRKKRLKTFNAIELEKTISRLHGGDIQKDELKRRREALKDMKRKKSNTSPEPKETRKKRQEEEEKQDGDQDEDDEMVTFESSEDECAKRKRKNGLKRLKKITETSQDSGVESNNGMAMSMVPVKSSGEKMVQKQGSQDCPIQLDTFFHDQGDGGFSSQKSSSGEYTKNRNYDRSSVQLPPPSTSSSRVLVKSKNGKPRQSTITFFLTDDDKKSIQESNDKWNNSPFSKPINTPKKKLEFETISRASQLREESIHQFIKQHQKSLKQSSMDSFLGKQSSDVSDLSEHDNSQVMPPPPVTSKKSIKKQQSTKPTKSRDGQKKSTISKHSNVIDLEDDDQNEEGNGVSTKSQSTKKKQSQQKLLDFLLPSGKIVNEPSASALPPSYGKPRRHASSNGYFIDDIKSDDEDTQDTYEMDGFIVEDASSSSEEEEGFKSSSEEEEEEEEEEEVEEQKIIKQTKQKKNVNSKKKPSGKPIPPNPKKPSSRLKKSTYVNEEIDLPSQEHKFTDISPAGKKKVINQDEDDDETEPDNENSQEEEEEVNVHNYMQEFEKQTPKSIKQEVKNLFSKKLSIKESFEVFLQYIVSCILDKDFINSVLGDENDRYFIDSLIKIKDLVVSKKELVVRSSLWHSDFLSDLQSRPNYYSLEFEGLGGEKCKSCSKSTHSATFIAHLSGDPYVPDDFWEGKFCKPMLFEDNEEQEEEVEYKLGSFCQKRSSMFHDLHHYPYRLYLDIKKDVKHYQRSHKKSSPTDILNHFINNDKWVQNYFNSLQGLLKAADGL